MIRFALLPVASPSVKYPPGFHITITIGCSAQPPSKCTAFKDGPYGTDDPEDFNDPIGSQATSPFLQACVAGAGAVVIGAKKCGTTTLAHFLGPHSKISVAKKEVHYFDQHLEEGNRS